MSNSKLFGLFGSYGDGTGFTQFYFICIFTSINEAKNFIINNYDLTNIITNELIHSNMKIENQYTYIGSRNDCKEETTGSICNRKCGGGFVIEEFTVNNPSNSVLWYLNIPNVIG